MYRRLFISSVLLAGGCVSEIPSYDEAISSAEAKVNIASVTEWGEKEVKPFMARSIEPVISKCARHVPEATTVTAHLVIDASGSPPPTQIRDDTPTPFSNCLKQELRELTWPKAPAVVRYLPIEINAHSPSSEGKSADDVIISITPSNTSLERTRER